MILSTNYWIFPLCFYKQKDKNTQIDKKFVVDLYLYVYKQVFRDAILGAREEKHCFVSL